MKYDPNQHPDDRLLKGLFKKQAAEIIPYLVPGLTLICPIEDSTEILFGEEEQTVSQVQYQIDPLIRENPTIMAIVAEEAAKRVVEEVAEGEARGEIKGLREAILDLISDRFPDLVVSQVQETIKPTQNSEQLRNFLRQLVRVSDEQEIPALLAQCFPRQDEMKLRFEGEIKGLQEAILDPISDRFSAQVVAQVQQAIAPTQDIEQLRKFNRQLARVFDEQEVLALLAQCFPTH